MKGWNIVARTCVLMLAASLITIDTMPAFAAEISEEAIVFTEEEKSDTPEKEAESVSDPEAGEEQEKPSGIQENEGLIYLNGELYNGYYVDAAGILYIVSNGAAEAKTGMLPVGARYYDYNAKEQTLSKKTLYVRGKVYTGYYLGSKQKMCSVKKGTSTPKTGTLKAGTKYYSYNAGKTLTVSKKTLYVKGKVYTGYYLNGKQKMCHVKKGTSIPKTGALKAGTKYYSYNAGKIRRVSKRTLYVGGKVYTGYYMSGKKKLYHVKKGTSTPKTGMLKAGTKYYSYRAQKTQKFSKKTLYVKGKVYTGYYLNGKQKMCSVKKGTSTLANAMLNAGTKYYSFRAGKTLKLSRLTVYVEGKAMEGMSPESLATLQRAQAVVARITNDGMTKEQKLRTCFEFVKTYNGSRPRTPHYTGMDWPVVYANDMFVNGSGNCCSYAASFAYLAKAVGYEEVYCCNDGGHGWVEVGGLVYDPERSKYDHDYSYYAFTYDAKTNVNYKGALAFMKDAWMHIKI